MDSKYNIISFNKEYLHSDAFKISIHNRAFRYGDGFFETMHANGLSVQFVEDHYKRILQAASIFQFELPEYFTLKFLKEQVSGLLSRCKLFQAARVKLIMYRTGEGLYIPESNKVDILIEAIYLGKGYYELNTNGLNIGIYDEIRKPALPYMSIKALNAQLYIMASLYAQKSVLDDVLLLNEAGALVEATSSNFFAVKGKDIFTPSLATGCVKGVMRKQIITIAKNMGYHTMETNELKPNHLIDMDELFLSNAVIGLKHVSGFKNRRYYNRNAKKLMGALNELAFSSSLD